jgi:hypothetical protein
LGKLRLLAQQGASLSSDDVKSLESSLETQPGDIQARVRLLGYYTKRHLEDDAAKKRRSQHVLWILKHEPESAIVMTPYARLELDREAYEEGKRTLFDQMTHRRRTRELLQNAAFFTSAIDKETAEALWEQAKGLPPSISA